MENKELKSIIKNTAKEILAPHGVTQRGSSRLWIDDHGWYTILVEFQPSSHTTGTYLNVGVHFHWYEQEHLSFDIGYRVDTEFIEYKENSVNLEKDITNLVQGAWQKVAMYREEFSSMQKAKATILSHCFTSNELWGNYHRGIISGLTGDIHQADIFFSEILKQPVLYDWIKDLQQATKHLQSLLGDSVAFSEAVDWLIRQSRKMKKLDKKY